MGYVGVLAVSFVFLIIFVFFSSTFSWLTMLPGLMAKREVRKRKIDLVDEVIQESLEYQSGLSGRVHKDRISELKGQVLRKLQEMGLSEDLAQALSSLEERLEWSPDEWATSVDTVKKLISQGYSEDLVSLHLRLSLRMPSALKLELLEEMYQAGVRDWASMKYAMVTSYTFEEFEEAIEMHEVNGFNWGHAIRKSSKECQRG